LNGLVFKGFTPPVIMPQEKSKQAKTGQLQSILLAVCLQLLNFFLKIK